MKEGAADAAGGRFVAPRQMDWFSHAVRGARRKPQHKTAVAAQNGRGAAAAPRVWLAASAPPDGTRPRRLAPASGESAQKMKGLPPPKTTSLPCVRHTEEHALEQTPRGPPRPEASNTSGAKAPTSLSIER
eukprot:5080562-Pleurochrysis_carterae.AAC.2